MWVDEDGAEFHSAAQVVGTVHGPQCDTSRGGGPPGVRGPVDGGVPPRRGAPPELSRRFAESVFHARICIPRAKRGVEPPFLVRQDQAKTEVPRSQTQLLKDFYRAVLQEGELAGWPYSLLSAATHRRFRQAGFAGYASTGPSVGGVSNAAMHVTLDVTAQSTMYAAFATRTYLCALAEYTGVPEAVVLGRPREPAAEWLAIAHHGAVS